MTRRLTRVLTAVAGLALAAGLAVGVDRSPTPVVVDPAADIGQFNPGNIISDAVFFDGGAMSADEVRRFIELKGMSCRAGSDGTPCLKDYRQDTTHRPADAYCTGYGAGTQESAATIISKAAQACGINPRVLLVMLQKEQSLVTNTGSSLYARRYREAMGYGCPDTAPCNPDYNGFQNQVYSAARRFQVYKANPTAYGYRAGRTNTVLYHPNRACGSSQVYIQNQATAGLYTYTPYQPNPAALAAGYGSGDSCSAYGNRNFWLYFTDWFGSTQRPGESAWQPIGALDTVTARSGAEAEVRGWTVDPDTAAPLDVHVYVDGVAQGVLEADVARPDVAAALPTWGAGHGYSGTVWVGRPGVHEVCTYAINVGSPAPNTRLGCARVDTGGLPFGSTESATISEGQGVLTGWALDLDTDAALPLHVYVNGAWGTAVTTGRPRADVQAAYPGAGPASGFSATVPLQPGANEVCVYAINTPAGANPSLGCRDLELRVDPIGDVRVAGGARAAELSGWALDPETTEPIDVHVYVDGRWAAGLTADVARPDVAAAVPGAGPRHGYARTLALSPGQHEVCVFAINVGRGTVNPELGCRDVLVGVPPIGHFESVSAPGATTRIRGWALDPDTAAPIDVHVYVDGRYAQRVTADRSRPDVGAAFPASGPAHGFETTAVLAPGQHRVCVYAINVLGGTTGNPQLGCRSVTVPASVPPAGSVDSVQTSPGHVVLRGWAYDPDVPATPISVHFSVDGRYAGQLVAGDSRPDVAAAVRDAGAAHGYTAYLAAPAGRRTVCAHAIDTAGGPNTTLRCVVVDVRG